MRHIYFVKYDLLVSCVINLFVPKGILVSRGREQLEKDIPHCFLMTRDGSSIACAMLKKYRHENFLLLSLFPLNFFLLLFLLFFFFSFSSLFSFFAFFSLYRYSVLFCIRHFIFFFIGVLVAFFSLLFSLSLSMLSHLVSLPHHQFYPYDYLTSILLLQ